LHQNQHYMKFLHFFIFSAVFSGMFISHELDNLPKCERQTLIEDTIKVETMRYFDQEDGCLKYSTKILYINERGTWLKHVAVMKTGQGCTTERMDEDHNGNGPYKGDWIVKDDLLNGKLRDFFDANPAIYQIYTVRRDSLIQLNLKFPIPKDFDLNSLPSGPKMAPTDKIKVKTDLYADTDQQRGCLKLRVSVIATETSGQVWLLHGADIKTGKNCMPQETQINQLADGPYKGDWILKDSFYNGSIRDYFDANPKIYQIYLKKRDSLVTRYAIKQ